MHEHLERVLNSSLFDGSTRSREFLRFVVEETLAGRGARLNQDAIAVRVFDRKGDFDAALDPIVRVQAGRLRRSLERYYLLSGSAETMRIELPKGSYAPEFVPARPTARAEGGRRVTPARVAPHRPTLLLHPLVVSSPGEIEVASRTEDEMAMELCRYGDVQIIRQQDMNRIDPAHRPSARFELLGSLRSDADDYVVSARLLDRETGEQVWSDEYHTSPGPGRWSSTIDDLGRIIAARVGAEQGVIARMLGAEHAVRAAEANDGCNAIIRCYRFYFSRQPDDLISSVEAVGQLTEKEPENALAWTYLARLYLVNHAFEVSQLQTPVEQAISYGYEAVLLDPTSTRARCTVAAALLVKGELQAALAELEQAMRLNSDSLAYREIAGWLMALAGDWQRGLALMQDAVRRNPYCLPHFGHGLWADGLRRGEFEEAYVAALEYRDQTFFWRELMLSCSLGHLGRLPEARRSAAELLRIKPQFPERGRTLIGNYIKPPELRERVVEGLRRAGIVLS